MRDENPSAAIPELLRSVLILALAWGLLLAGLSRALDGQNGGNVRDTALAYAGRAATFDPAVFHLVSVGNGGRLRAELEAARLGFSNRSRGCGGRPAVSNLRARVLTEGPDRAEVLVRGAVFCPRTEGEAAAVNGSMLVRLVRENGIWRVW